MRMVGGWSSTGLFAGDSTQTAVGSMTNGSEVFDAFTKTRLLIKLNPSFILKNVQRRSTKRWKRTEPLARGF